MDGDVELLKRIYDRFNARDIVGVLAVLADDVAWANGMDGGHVHGREAVREYWTRQCPSSRGQGGSLRHTGCCLIPIFTAKLEEIFFGFGKVGPQVVHGAS
jgi:hypothetical protein